MPDPRSPAELRDQTRRGSVAPGATVVFVHTGGLPALFRYSSELVEPVA